MIYSEKTVSEIRKGGGEAYGFKVDVTNRQQVYETAKKVENLAGNVTLLVNNAGIVGGTSFLDAKDEVIQKTFEVNSISHFWTTKAVLPSMIEHDHGHIGSIFHPNYLLTLILKFRSRARQDISVFLN